jgi:hypothetical protein
LGLLEAILRDLGDEVVVTFQHRKDLGSENLLHFDLISSTTVLLENNLPDLGSHLRVCS